MSPQARGVPDYASLHPGYAAPFAGPATAIAYRHSQSVVMPGLVPGIHVVRAARLSVDGRDKPGHDAVATLGPPDSLPAGKDPG